MIGGSWLCRYASTVGDLQPPFHALQHVERSALRGIQARFQRDALDVIHHQIETIVFNEGVRHFGQIGMVEPDEKAGLMFAAVQFQAVLRLVPAQAMNLFHGHNGVQPDMFRLVDGSHAPLPQRRLYLVAPVEQSPILQRCKPHARSHSPRPKRLCVLPYSVVYFNTLLAF